MAAKWILLVEDNSDDAELTLRAFGRIGIESGVVVARDGVEALDYLRDGGAGRPGALDGPPALVLLDLQLPKLSGVEVLRRLRSDDRTRLIPVVMLTSSVEPDDILESYRAGANGYVRKVIDAGEFEQLVRGLAAYWLRLNQLPPTRGFQ